MKKPYRVELLSIDECFGFTIKERVGPPVRAERLPRYTVWKDGRLLEEFRRLSSAQRWCNKENKT